MPLPNPGMSFTPFDPLPASDLNDMVENIEALQDWSAFDNNSFPVALIAAGGLSASKLISTAIGHGYVEIGRTTLGVAGDTISVTSIPGFKYLRIFYFCQPTGGTINTQMRFNNDSGNNYAARESLNGGADGTSTSSAQIIIGAVATAAVQMYGVIDVGNIASQEKVVINNSMSPNAAGAATAPGRKDQVAKWANTSVQISRVDVFNTGTGDFAIGSEVLVLGKN